MHPRFFASRLVAAAALFVVSTAPVGAAERPLESRQRMFRFNYAGHVSDLAPGETARVWIPIAENSPQQQVRIETIDVPAAYQLTREGRYGNALIYFETQADEEGKISFKIEYDCRRRERSDQSTDASSPCERSLFLRPTRLIPLDAKLLSGWAPTRQIESQSLSARTLYDAVDRHMKYAKPQGRPWGRGDARWACDSGYGNCTDFHSLFLAACRFHRIPARFEIGFPLPSDRSAGAISGYHCWASFERQGKWTPVDISEADKHPQRRDYFFGRLDPHRIRFSIGRDLKLEPPQAAGPVNYLIYPYVEVDGRPHSSLIKSFSFFDIEME